MVPIAIQTGQRGTLESAQKTGPSSSVAGTGLASKSRQTTTLCMAAEEPELLFRSCNMNVKNMILNSEHPPREIHTLADGNFLLIGVLSVG